MGLQVRPGTAEAQKAIVNEINNLRDISVGTNIHACVTAGTAPSGDPLTVTALAITSPNGNGTVANAIALANELRAKLNIMFQDPYAHKSALTNVITTPIATDLASAITLANAEKAAYEAHRTQANVHFTNDTVNTIAAVNATDQASLDTLLNEMKTDVTAHIAAALTGQHIQFGPA